MAAKARETMEGGSKACLAEDRVQRWHWQVLAAIREVFTGSREQQKVGRGIVERKRRDIGGVSGIFLVSPQNARCSSDDWGRESRVAGT
jgi:hypothetical protein